MVITYHGVEQTFNRIAEFSEERQRRAIREVTNDVFENLKLFARPHHQTGTLEGNLRHRISGNVGVVWIDNDNMMVNWNGGRVNYVNFVLFGTRPHTIRPKTKKSLRWSGLHGFVFAKRVHHPGYRGDDFLHKAVETTFRNLDTILRRV